MLEPEAAGRTGSTDGLHSRDMTARGQAPEAPLAPKLPRLTSTPGGPVHNP